MKQLLLSPWMVGGWATGILWTLTVHPLMGISYMIAIIFMAYIIDHKLGGSA